MHRRVKRLQVGLAGQVDIDGLGVAGRLEQERKAVARVPRGEGDPCTQHERARSLLIVERRPPRRGQGASRASSSEPAWYLACEAASARPPGERGRASVRPRAPERRRRGQGLHGTGRGLPSARARRRCPHRAPARHARDARPAGRDPTRRPLLGECPVNPVAVGDRGCRRPQNERGGWANSTRAPAGAGRASTAASAAAASSPSVAAARWNSTGSPRGSAAAVSTSSWVRPGVERRRAKLPRSCRQRADCGNAEAAREHPGVPGAREARGARVGCRGPSVTIWSHNGRVERAVHVLEQQGSRVAVAEPFEATAPGARPGPGRSRRSVPRNDHDPLGESRRATKPRICSEAPSSHCASSTMQASGRPPATSANRAEHGETDQKRSAPARSSGRRRWRVRLAGVAGRRPALSSIGAQSW